MTAMNGRVPLLGQGMSRDQQAKLEILQMMSTLSLNIYSKMACEYLGTLEHIDPVKLQSMAKNSRMAAEAYFEALGIIQK